MKELKEERLEGWKRRKGGWWSGMTEGLNCGYLGKVDEVDEVERWEGGCLDE